MQKLQKGLQLFRKRVWIGFVKPSESKIRRSLHRRELAFLVALLLCMALATGPGVLLVNRPETVFGFPIIYVWGVAWFLIIAVLAVLTDQLVWKKDCELQETEEKGGPKVEE